MSAPCQDVLGVQYWQPQQQLCLVGGLSQRLQHRQSSTAVHAGIAAQQHVNFIHPLTDVSSTPFSTSSSSSRLQEIVRPDVFWYDAPTKVALPFNILGLLAFEFFAMHFVEIKRWQDFRNPGSQDVDPLFPNNKIAPHEVRNKNGVWLQ